MTEVMRRLHSKVCHECGKEIYEWEPAVLYRGHYYHLHCYEELFGKPKKRELWHWSREWKPIPMKS
jgi:hypothetical protein